MAGKSEKPNEYRRQQRRNQILFGAIAVILILSYVLSLVVQP